jgi:hypothetical protein
MGLAALILGILGLMVAWVPFCGAIAIMPCLIGLGLGIADIAIRGKKREPVAMGIVGTVLNGVALLLVLIVSIAVVMSKADQAPSFIESFKESYQRSYNEAIRKAQEKSQAKIEESQPTPATPVAPAAPTAPATVTDSSPQQN